MSARKSTTRRKPASKGHVPYNDDLAQGRRTGRAIDRVRNDSDGFERFTDLMDQAYTQTPPKVTNTAAARRKRKSTPGVVNDDDHHSAGDDDDEDDDDNDDAGGAEPLGRDDSYDDPSPERWQPPQRDDPVSPPSPQLHARHSFRYNDNYGNDGQGITEDDLYDDPMGQPEDSPSTGRRTHVRDPSPSSSHADKRKRSRRETDNEDTAVESFPEPDDAGLGGEEEIAEEEEGQQPPPKKKQRKSPPPKKVKVRSAEPTKPRRPVTIGAENEVPNSKSNNGLIVRQRLQDATNTSDDDAEARGLRRSKRVRYTPLDWWRLEKVVYGRRQSGAGSVVPVIKEIIRRPKPEDEPLAARNRRKRWSKPPSSKGKGKAIEREPTPEDEQGLDDETDPNGEVRDYVTGDIVQRRVAFTAGMVNPKPAEKNDFLFQKIFGDGDFIAAGQLVIPPGKKKPVKPSRDNSYVFYLIEGAVRFQVHQSEFVLTTGGMFMAPRGNYYLIKNVASRPAKIFFAQARKVAPEPNVAPAVSTPRRQSGTPGGAPSSDARAILPTSKAKAG